MTQTTPTPVRHPAPTRTIVIAAVVDVVLVLVFVLIGRSSHSEGFSLGGTLVTFWPFLVGLVVGWVATRAWRYPLRLVLPGIPIWLFTVAVGMFLRVLSGQGVEVSFVIVALIVLGVFLLGWRLIGGFVSRRVGARRSSGSDKAARNGWQ
ncbi:MAG: rane protein [Subtercola sp.]|nr:rane protein [Subtercola sp.]